MNAFPKLFDFMQDEELFNPAPDNSQILINDEEFGFCPIDGNFSSKNFFQDQVYNRVDQKSIIQDDVQIIIPVPIEKKDKEPDPKLDPEPNPDPIEISDNVEEKESFPFREDPEPNPDPIEISDNVEEKESFPFREGKGLKQLLEKLGLYVEEDGNKIKISLYKDKKFDVKVLIKDSNGKLKKGKQKRKLKPDNIKKKIKARFHKDLSIKLYQIFNESNKAKIKKYNSAKSFQIFPQSFIVNTEINKNKLALGMKFREFFPPFCKQIFIEKEKEPNKIKSCQNKETILYLMNNLDVRKKEKFEKILDMTYEELLKAYFCSAEFEKSLVKLYNENKNEKIEYFEDYINISKTYIHFFKYSKAKPKKKKTKKENNNNENDNKNEN